MGSRVNVCCVRILDNPSGFNDEFKLEITFEVFEHLPHDLEWELVYVGSGKGSEYDQVLDSVLIGPTPEGKHKFIFGAPAPKSSKIPDEDIVGVSVLLLKCRYNGQEFLNLGWFVSIEYETEELKEAPPSKPIVEKLRRTIQTDDLRVTSFPIKWDDNQDEEYPTEQEEQQFTEDDLMPLEDTGEEDPEEEEDEAEAANGEIEDIELEESGMENDGDTNKDDEGSNVNNEGITETMSEDVEMGAGDQVPAENTAEATGVTPAAEASEKPSEIKADPPLADVTNDN